LAGIVGLFLAGISLYGDFQYANYSEFGMVFAEAKGALLGMLFLLVCVLLFLPKKSSL
jgi:hypothetical protein